MENQIHPTAIIESSAELDGVTVGAYAYIGANVKIGKGTNIHHHATVDGATVMGEDNEVFSYAYIGAKTQDLKYKGGVLGLKIGDRNTFREYVSIHLATNDEDNTTVGNDNVLLAYSHVAHECHVGNYLVMSSHAALGGHVIVGDHVNVGWSAGVHQFCRLGDFAMAGACSKVVQDVPPYMIADGNPAEVRTINKIGLERNGFSVDDISLARKLYKFLYREGLNRGQALEKIHDLAGSERPVVQKLIAFIEASERGLA